MKAWALSGVLGLLAAAGLVLAGGGDLAGAARSEGERFLGAGERGRARRAYERALVLAEGKNDRRGKFLALVGLGDSDPPLSDGQLALDSFRRARKLAVGREAGAVEAHRQFDLGVRAAWQEKLDVSATHLRAALTAARRSGERRFAARCLGGLGNVALRQDEWPQAEAFYKDALRATRGTGDLFVPILAHRGLGDTLFALGRIPESLRNFEEALVCAHRAGHRDMIEGILNAAGTVYLDLADYGRALQLFEEALRTGTEDPGELSYALNNIGIVHVQQGNTPLGVEYFHRSLAIAEELKDDYARMRVFNNVGSIYQGQRKYGLALQYLSRALRLAEGMKDLDAMAGDWKSLGTVYEDQGDGARAEAAYRRSLKIAESVGSRGLAAEARMYLSQLNLRRGDPRQAEELADRSAAMAAQTGVREVFWRARTLAGRALRAQGQDAEARRAYADAIATVEQMRSRIAGGEIGGESFLEGRLEPYQRLVELEADRGEADAALAAAERAKGRILLENLRHGRVDLASRLTAVERAAEQGLRERLASLNSEIFLAREQGNPGASRRLEWQREEARRALESFNAGLYAARPGLRARRADFPDWDLGSARGLLARGRGAATALLEYAVLEDRTVLFTVTADGGGAAPTVRLYRLPVGRADLVREVEAFRARLAARDLDFRAPARRLYELLLAPAAAELRGKTVLCIVPDGPLWDLPFQALQPGEGESLLERHALHYAPSLAFLAELEARGAQRPRPAATLLAVADPRLPEAEQEIQALAGLYGPGRGTVFAAAPSEKRIKAEAGRHRVLHFATHALLDDHNPLYSSLVLFPARPGQAEDGLLEAWEILDLHLDADLVALSACQTARGRPRDGEGMIGMSWALAAAGSPATLASQWEVDSASTRRLMVEFHRGWLAGLGKAEALRRAALAVRAEPRYRHPFYWAGFVLVGEGD